MIKFKQNGQFLKLETRIISKGDKQGEEFLLAKFLYVDDVWEFTVFQNASNDLYDKIRMLNAGENVPTELEISKYKDKTLVKLINVGE